MRKVREVLRLYHAAGLSIRAIARSLGASPTTAGDYVRRAYQLNLKGESMRKRQPALTQTDHHSS